MEAVHDLKTEAYITAQSDSKQQTGTCIRLIRKVAFVFGKSGKVFTLQPLYCNLDHFYRQLEHSQLETMLFNLSFVNKNLLFKVQYKLRTSQLDTTLGISRKYLYPPQGR